MVRSHVRTKDKSPKNEGPRHLSVKGALVHHLAAFWLDIQVRDVEVRDGP